jgi:predicted alpha/beta-fold hydrolase
MPYIECSSYIPPRLLKNSHMQSFYSVLMRAKAHVDYLRERIDTPDGDFLDLDWALAGNSDVLAIISHGLVGDSNQPYMRGMVKVLNKRGISALALNQRGCSGEPNRKPFSYHCGFIDDLHLVTELAAARGCFRTIILIGFSMGGNVVLKYMGERAESLNALVRGGVVFSTPCDLASCAPKASEGTNALYFRWYMRGLRRRILVKAHELPSNIHLQDVFFSANWEEFDNRFTAPLFGFDDARDYWQKASSIQHLPNLNRPVLLVNAMDDPLLSASCYPVVLAKEHPYFYLEAPERGGHVGFVEFNSENEYWSEKRALQFILHVIQR